MRAHRLSYPFPQFVYFWSLTISTLPQECTDYLAVLLILDGDDASFGDGVVLDEALFYFGWIDVLAA